MEKLDKKINAWLRDYLIPHLANVFGETRYFQDVKYTVTLPKGSFYLSDLFFTSIKFSSCEKRVLVKLPSQNPVVRSRINYTELFTNEIFFYQKIAVKDSSDYPKCYLAQEDPLFGHIIVLEDVRVHGYFICPEKVDIHIDYAIAGLQAIGRFHGKMYTIKDKNPTEFNDIVESIIESRYKKKSVNQSYKDSVNIRTKRVIETLRNRNYDVEFTKKIEKLFEDCFTNILMESVKPIEPLATIVHGDSTVNNILFRELKNNKNESYEAMLIDFALLMYASPAIDIGTLMYMTCKREDIRDKSEYWFKAYHDSLMECLKERNSWDPVKYSYEALWDDYEHHAIFGYIIAVYFRAMMTEYDKNNDILQLDDEIVDEMNITGGGDSLSNLLVDMLIDVREAGFLASYL